MNIIIPETVELRAINTNKGSIEIKNLNAPIHVSTYDGKIKINNSAQSVIAKTTNGSIKVKQKELNKDSSIFLETLNGDVDLFLPKGINASLQGKTSKGVLTSELEITLHPITTKLNKETWERMKREASGTIGNEGAPITIDVNKGDIHILEY